MANELYVCDVDYDVLACKIQDYWEIEDKIIQEVLEILKNVLEDGISSGEAHDSIEIIRDTLKDIYINSKDQGEKINDITLKFLDRIDQIDLKLYGG